MNRRNLLSVMASCSLGGLNVLSSRRAFGSNCTVQRLPGVQLFSFREGLQQDPGKVLAQLHAIGVREIELYGLTGESSVFGMPLTEFYSLLRHQGLEMSFSHISGDNINVPAVSAAAKALRINTVVLAIAPGFMQQGPDGLVLKGPQNKSDLDQLAELLNQYGRSFAEHGINFAYHNHHIELMPVEGHVPLDYLADNTDPEYVRLELDLGWIALAGADPVDYLQRLGDRVIACHLKDYTGAVINKPLDFITTATELVAPGNGVIDYPAVMDEMDALKIRHGFVEVDVTSDPLASVRSGLDYVTGVRAC